MFATMRRKQRGTAVKNELGQSVDHFRRAATIAAQETSATVGPKLTAAKDRVQPAATKAKDAASSGWDSAVATITPLVAAAGDNLRSTGKETKKQAKANRKAAGKRAAKLQRRADKALSRKRGGGKSRLLGFALLGTAVGVGAAYVVRKRKAAQWDEYDPAPPATVTTPATGGPAPTTVRSTTPVVGADDAAFEPADSPTVYGQTDTVVTEGTADQTASAQHSPTVARLASGKNKD